MSIEKLDKLGDGSYGIVYSGKMTKDDGNETEVAIKRNYGDEDDIGISTIREMNFLRYFSHPCIVKLKNISAGDPFHKQCPMTPRPVRSNMREDSHHFILEHAGITLNDYIIDVDHDYYDCKIIMSQILLGIEYIHAKKVIHRDLKTENILVKEIDGMPYARICDFGLSRFHSNYRPSTPGTYTSWYRAPEVCCCYDDYGFPADMWAVGCIFYQIFAGSPLVKVNSDNGYKVFKEIIKRIPHKNNTIEIKDYMENGDCDKSFKSFKIVKENKFQKNMNEIDERVFDSVGGSKSDLIKILMNLLNIHPEKRMTASECLKHPFFEIQKPFIQGMREQYPPILDDTRELVIIDCIERRWACNITIDLYNRGERIKWYNDHIIFHSLRIFDEYLAKNYNEETNPRSHVTEDIGQLLSKQKTTILFYTIIYTVHKFQSTLYESFTWKEIFPKKPVDLTKNKYKKDIIRNELEIVEDLCNYVVFRPTLLEYLDDDYTHQSNTEKDIIIRKYLVNYCDIGMNYKGDMKDFYKQIKSGLS